MFAVDEVTAEAIRNTMQTGGELSAVSELRRSFLLITDNAEAKRGVRIIASSKPLLLAKPIRGRRPRYPLRRDVPAGDVVDCDDVDGITC
jgi:hypothetical protein